MVEGYKNPSTAVGQDHFLFGSVSYCFVLFNNLILRSGFRFVAAVRLEADNDLFTRLTCCFTAHSIAYRDFLLLHTHTQKSDSERCKYSHYVVNIQFKMHFAQFVFS